MRLTLPLFAIAVVVTCQPAIAQEKEALAVKHYSYSARFFCSEPADRRLPGDCERCWDTEIALSNTGRAEANVEIWAVEARPISENPAPSRRSNSCSRPTTRSSSAAAPSTISSPPNSP